MTALCKLISAERDRAFPSMVMAVMLLLLACFMCGCRTQYVPVETVRTEYKDRVNTEYVTDSMTDTRFVFIKGDTVIDYRDRVKWREREVHDSIYINKTDTISVPYPVERTVEVVRKPCWWEMSLMAIGALSLIFFIFLTYKNIKKALS